VFASQRFTATLLAVALNSSVEVHASTRLVEEPLIAAITMAELAAGPQAAADPTERARRQDRLQRAEASFTPLPFGDGAARAYGRIYAEVAAAGRKGRGPRALDLLIASIALDAGLPLFTRNPSDVEPYANSSRSSQYRFSMMDRPNNCDANDGDSWNAYAGGGEHCRR
jgi:predicted nucleic acid-binding protein